MPRDPLDELIEDLEKALRPKAFAFDASPQGFADLLKETDRVLYGHYRRPQPDQVAPQDTEDDPTSTKP